MAANVITEIDDIEQQEDREAIEELIGMSKQLFVARGREAEAKEQKSDIWNMMKHGLEELGADVSFKMDGVKLSWSRGGKVKDQVPDGEKIAAVAPHILERRAQLKHELAEVEFEIGKLEKTHTKIVEVHQDSKLTVNKVK